MDPVSAMPSIFCTGLYLHLEHAIVFTQAQANTYTLLSQSYCERQGHLQSHDAVECLFKKLYALNHVIHEVTVKASILRADHLYYQLKTENENLLLQSSPRERIKRVKKFAQGDRKKKKKEKNRKK